MEIQEKSKTSRERIKKVNTSQSTKQEEVKEVKEIKQIEEIKEIEEPKKLEVPKIMTAIAALTIRELVNLANKYGIKREDVITIVKDNGQYVLIHYSPSI